MFLPGSLGNVLPRAALPKIEESIWYPSQEPPAVTINPDNSADVGINLGVQFAISVQGVILSICYWRWSDLAPSNGTVALWNADERITPRELVASQNFTGHSGTGWKRVDFAVPVEVSTAKSYFATVWIPESGDGFIYYGSTPYFFPSTPLYSENLLLWAWPNSGAPYPPHGIYKHNGWFKYGALACPDDSVASSNYWVDVVFRGSPLPAPPDPPIVLKWEIPPGYPDLSNTGIPPGTVLTPVVPGVSVATTHDGEIIEDLDLHEGGIIVVHHNCTIRRCKIYFRGGYGIIAYPEFVGTIIEDCDINSGFRANGPAQGIGGNPLVIRRCNIYRGENGIVGFGNYGGGDTSVTQIYEDNFVHSLRSSPGTPHYDCVQFNGGAGNIIVRHNTFHNENTDTSAILIQNLFGPIYGIRIEDNILAGGGFTSYCVGRTEDPTVDPIVVQYYGNQLHIGAYGYIIDTQTDPTMAGNKFMDHGSIYDAAPPDGFVADQIVRERFFGMPNGASIVPGSVASDAVPGLTLGISFQVAQDTSIVGVNIPKLRTPGETITYKVGIWRFTGANLSGGKELLSQLTISFTSGIREGWEHLPFDMPVSVDAGDNILLGVWCPPGADGRVWFTVRNGTFGDNVDSQFGRATAFNGAGVPFNGFTGGNGLFNYGPDLAPPLNQTGSRPSYNIDPIFEAPWVAGVDNVAPTATNLSAAEGYFEDTPINLIDIVVSDVDSPNVTATLTLSNPAAGSLSTATSGAVTSTYNAGTGVWTASGAIADVNALLAGVTFTPATGFTSNFSIATSVSDGEAPAITGTKSVTYTVSVSGSIPLSYFDTRFNTNTPSSEVVLSSGTLLKKSITDTGETASIVAEGNVIIDTCRVNSRECVRMAGNVVDIRNCYLEANGVGDDHADTIQAYDPGQHTGTIIVTDTAVVLGTEAVNAGLFIADDWGGIVTLQNVMFKGGLFGLRLIADPGCTINVSLKDVYFVGPFTYDSFSLEQGGSGVMNVTHWENVRNATIVDGVLVPGDLIEEP